VHARLTYRPRQHPLGTWLERQGKLARGAYADRPPARSVLEAAGIDRVGEVEQGQGAAMKRPVRVLVVGIGAMGAMCTRFLIGKGAEVVAAVSRVSHVGQELGAACGLDKAVGVVVEADLKAALETTRPDIAVVCTASYVTDVAELVADCLRKGVSVITTAEECLYSWRTRPVLTAELDALARENNATMTGSGYTDYFWGGEVFQLAGCCHDIRLIEGLGQFNVDDYGSQVARNNHVGDSTEVFEDAFAGRSSPGFFQTVGDLLCAHLGLTVADVRESVHPATAECDLECAALEMTVRRGDVTGKVTVVDVETAEGAALHLELQERLYLPGEADLNRWVIHGTPDVTVENPRPATDVLTCATVVNRIPDVLNAPPGYVTVDSLPPLRFRPRPLDLDANGTGRSCS
jgi:2,4-diaminopentanoate dehydrogenase